MYRAFFGLRDRPFDLTPNPRFLVLTEAHKEALSHLEYGIASRRGITALIGEAGTGKTTLIRTALERQPEKVHCVYLHNPALTRAEFVETLATRFSLTVEARTSKAALLTELEVALRDRNGRGESTVLVVDEAQSLSLELLEEIRLLGNIETIDTKLLSIVLAGQPELAARLNQPSLRQLKQRIALRCELRALTEGETAAYLAGRIRAAGGAGAQVFTREAVILIHKRAAGIPRAVSVIADNALLSAYAVQRKPVNSQVVAEVCRDLDLPAAAPGGEANRAPDGDLSQTLVMRSRASMLAFEPPDQSRADSGGRVRPDRPAEAKNDTGREQNGEDESSTQMFTSVFSKRRRFSFFFGQ